LSYYLWFFDFSEAFRTNQLKSGKTKPLNRKVRLLFSQKQQTHFSFYASSFQRSKTIVRELSLENHRFSGVHHQKTLVYPVFCCVKRKYTTFAV
jgi:hypothetical protein